MDDDRRTRRELRRLRLDAFHGFAWAARRLGTAFDPQEPETSIARLTPALGPTIDVVTRWRLGRVLVRTQRVIDSTDFERVIRHAVARNARRRTTTDGTEAVIDSILDRAHACVPFAPLGEFQNLCLGVDPPDGGWPGTNGRGRPPRGRAALVAAMAELQGLHGERRARCLLSVWKELCETQYADRVLGLANVVRRAAGRAPVETASIGQALGLVRELGDPRLARVVEMDAALFRNAFAHSHYRYLPAEAAVALWDRSVGRRVVAVADLEERLERAAAFAIEIVPGALRRFIVRRCLISTGLLKVLLEERGALVLGDAEQKARARDRLDALFRREFAPLDQLALAES